MKRYGKLLFHIEFIKYSRHRRLDDTVCSSFIHKKIGINSELFNDNYVRETKYSIKTVLYCFKSNNSLTKILSSAFYGETAMKKIVLTLLTSLLMLTGVQAATLYGVDVADSTTLAEQELVLNGVGIRKKGPFKVYLGALYLGSKTNNADAILKDEGAKRVQLNMLRNLAKKKMVGAIVDGFKANTSDMASIQVRVDEFISYMDKVKKGDSIQFDYIPATGTNIVINGKNKGTIVGKDFFDALMKVWLGERPADGRLKAAMLGS